jgi:hypothetical protein
MAESLEETIRRLAGNRCEYCRVPEAKLGHVLDHIIARQHAGKTEFENLALRCGRCNQYKGPNVAGIDPQTNQLVRLQDRWFEHFRYETAVLIGLTPIGRATVTVLAINHPLRIDARQALIAAGKWFLPTS